MTAAAAAAADSGAATRATPLKQQQQQAGAAVEAAIASMAAAVQRGDFAAAEAAGAAAPVHLALPRAALTGLRPLSEGAQACVFRAHLAPARLLSTVLHGGEESTGAAAAGPEGSLEVALKRPRIRETADLERFRREVALLAALAHPHIVRLLGARLLPPGAWPGGGWDAVDGGSGCRGGRLAAPVCQSGPPVLCCLAGLSRRAPAADRRPPLLSPPPSSQQTTRRCWRWRRPTRRRRCTARAGARPGR